MSDELDRLNAERQAEHEHEQAERMERATTVRAKPRRWSWRRLLGIAGLVVVPIALAPLAAACTPQQRWTYWQRMCQGNNSGFCQCAFGPQGWGPDRCWGYHSGLKAVTPDTVPAQP